MCAPATSSSPAVAASLRSPLSLRSQDWTDENDKQSDQIKVRTPAANPFAFTRHPLHPHLQHNPRSTIAFAPHKSFHAKVRVSNPRFTLFTRSSPSNPFPGHHSLDTARRRRPPSVLALAPSPPAPLIPVLSPSLAYSLPRSLLHDLAHSPHVLAPSPSPLLLPPHTGAAGRRHLRLGDICRGD